LRTTDAGLRLFAEPVREIETLHQRPRQWQNQTLKSDAELAVGSDAELFHVQAELDVRNCDTCGFNVRGVSVVYNARKQELTCFDKTAPLPAVDGTITLELIVDRTSIEIFGNHGRIYMPMRADLVDKPESLDVFTTGGNTRIVSLKVYELESIWP
jgi:sucrose-6-phosphate hydrolase SacC (GH32 family)